MIFLFEKVNILKLQNAVNAENLSINLKPNEQHHREKIDWMLATFFYVKYAQT